MLHRETDLDFSKLEGLEEWVILDKHLSLLERDYLDYALNSKTMELKEYYRGKIDIIREVRRFPSLTHEQIREYLGWAAGIPQKQNLNGR